MISQLQHQLPYQPAKLIALITSWHQALFSLPRLLSPYLNTTRFASQGEIALGTQAKKSWLIGIRAFLILFTLVIILLGSAGKAAAEDVFEDICAKAPTSAACQDKNAVDGYSGSQAKNPLFGPNGVLTTVVSILGILVGIAAVVSIIVAGIKYMTSGNNPQEITNARELVLYALIALFVIAFSQILVRFFLNRVF